MRVCSVEWDVVYICSLLELSVKMSRLLLKLSQHSSLVPPSLCSLLLCDHPDSKTTGLWQWDFKALYANVNQIKVNPLSWSNFSIDIQIRWSFFQFGPNPACPVSQSQHQVTRGQLPSPHLLCLGEGGEGRGRHQPGDGPPTPSASGN